MPSNTETLGKAPNQSRSWMALERWNRKLHFYSGLFLFLFLWLFAASGLLLNHPSWNFDEYWKNRRETNYEREISNPGPEVKGDLAQAHEIMRQTGIDGEILWTTTRTDTNVFDFQVRRLGLYFFIKADFARRVVSVRQADVNVWGVMKVLHTFSGVQLDDPRNRRDWALTSLWAYSMDGVAIGLIFMVLSSFYMWYQLPQKRVFGLIVIGVGSLACGV